MEGYSRKEEKCNKVLFEGRSHGVSEEKKLELRLGPPDGEWCVKDRSKVRGRDDSHSHLSFTHFSCASAKRGFLEAPVNGAQPPHQFSSFLGLQSPSQSQCLPVRPQEPSQPGCSKGVDLNSSEKMAFSPPAVPNTSQKRTAPSPVVGWPPLRSFRKNLASSSSLKQIPESQNAVSNKFSSEKPMERSQKGFFVKINMDGIPIGRKVDLSAYDSYEKLASAVNELFKGLLAAQTEGGEKAITGLLDGSGEYTLVYEDNEGDTMLVGDDVHWQMFVSTVKRLRVLKTSELSSLSRGKQVKL
ncbi:PREDICTED: auxin-responsive protein IAA26-like [Ipomoea nil]|uniref:auxin-responsive protein IAA26-like n=1 Tax=Ipomoea nil TaxID=35883 RepID=UPI0009008A17|nr:PREDICTED: auxin-responsive protein IAA26-like [Ipomoea nil]